MIDLDALRAAQPKLPPGLPEALATYAAVALQRRYRPGVALAISIDDGEVVEALTWRPRTATDAQMVDTRRATEDGAECIALSIVERSRLRRRGRGAAPSPRPSRPVAMAPRV
jgi:hypothetical protein